MIVGISVIDKEDYNQSMATITVLAGKSVQSLTVDIFNDNIVECFEIFNVIILPIKSCGFAIGSNSISLVMIKDNDSKFHVIVIVHVLAILEMLFTNRSSCIISTITLFSSRK